MIKLTDLPDELLRQTAQHLDKNSATTLAMVCRDLQDAAESQIWRDLTYCSCDLSTSSRSVSCCTCVGRHPSWQRGIFCHLDLLKSPRRAGYVRKIGLELEAEIPVELTELLDRVAGGLRELCFTLLLCPVTLIPTNGCMSTDGLFRSLRAPLTSLYSCRIEVRNCWQETVLSLLRIAPNLGTLTIRFHFETTPTGGSPSNSYIAEVPQLPYLTELVVVEARTCHIPLLASFVHRAPSLKSFISRDYAFHWLPTHDDSLLMALSHQVDSTTLEIPFAGFQVLCDSSGFRKLENLLVLWEAAQLQERQTKVRHTLAKSGGSFDLHPL